MRINLNGTILTALTRIFDTILVTVLFLLCCLPVVTIGAACAAMYAAMIAIVGDSCTSVVRCFVDAFRSNFKQATLLFLPGLLVGAVVAVDIAVCFGFEMEPTLVLSVMRGLTVFCTGLYTAMFVYTFSGIAVFQVTRKQALSNALFWTVKKLPATLLLLLIVGAMAFSVAVLWYFAFPVIVLGLYLQGRILHRIFDLGVPKLHHEEEIDYT